MGAFSTAQFMGAFLGGALGGWFSSHYGIPGVFGFCAASALIWFVVAQGMTMPKPRPTATRNDIQRGGEIWPEG